MRGRTKELRVRRLGRAASLLFLALGGASLAGGATDPVVIELGGLTVTRSELNERFQIALHLLARQQGVELGEQNPAVIERLREQYLQKRATELVFLAEASRRGIVVSPDEVTAAVADALGEDGENGFLAPLQALGIDGAEILREIVRDERTVQALTAAMLEEIVVPPGDVITLHHDIKEQLATPESACVRHIQLGSEASARSALARLDAGAEFPALAKEISNDPASAQRGGDLGCFEKGSMIDRSAFENAVFAARKGDIVGPVESEHGFHVIEVYEHTPYHLPTLNEAYSQVERELKHERLPGRINALIGDSGVRTYPERFAAMPAGE